jgi:hypothetical protein
VKSSLFQITMNDDRTIHELLEAFRPGVDNLAEENWSKLRESLAADAELQQRASALRQSDHVVRTAMHDVPVPAGLAERLLANLTAKPTDELLTSAPSLFEQAIVELPAQPVSASRVGRRTWGALTALATLAVVSTVIFLAWNARPHDSGDGTIEQLVERVEAWEADPAFSENANWKPLPDHVALASSPIQVDDLASTLQSVAGPVRRKGLLVAAYQLTNGRGQSARLYVAHTGKAFALGPTPSMPLPTLTGTRQAAAWQRGEYLYVVVTHSGEARPEDFVRRRKYT